jgi:hypothetical protein
MNNEPAETTLSHLLDPEAAQALAQWAHVTGREIQLPTKVWRRKGFTGAVLTQIYVTERGRGSRLVVVKFVPRPQVVASSMEIPSEGGALLRALVEAREFKSHLVDQPFDSIRLHSGGALIFQNPAGDGSSWLPVSELPPSHLAEACEVLVESLISDWNSDFTIQTGQQIVTFLHDETVEINVSQLPAELSEGARWPLWFRTHHDPPMPNPLRLCGSDSVFAQDSVDLIMGRTHGDLHDLNVLMRHGRGKFDPHSFVLVDLSTYSGCAQLGRDVVRLLLSVMARLMPGLSDTQQRLLLMLFVAPDMSETQQLPSAVVDIVTRVYERTASLTIRLGGIVWRQQYLLSLIAQALAFTAFRSLGPCFRWWCFRLAGYAARQLLVEFERGSSIPPDAAVMANPFDADVESSSSLSRSAARRLSRHGPGETYPPRDVNAPLAMPRGSTRSVSDV